MMYSVERPLSAFLFILLPAFVLVSGWEDYDDIHYTNSWAVHIEDGDPEVANRIAKRHGFVNLGQVGSLPGYYHFVHNAATGRRKRREVDKSELLLTEKEVKWVEQQQVLERDKRSIIPDFVGIARPKAVTIQDPLYKDQWYLNNIGQSSGPPNLDINVLPVWSKGVTGRGVVVAILDDGVDYTHPDLVKNFDSKASYDFNDYDNDPMPRISDPNNCHGTKCAGQVAAESGNGICGVGVAFNASIGGIRMLDGNTTDTIEGSSLSYRNNYIHIYSCAWGPKDDGKRFGRPGTLASKALQLGTKEGRGGLGSIFVWATGNGGLTDDDCNCDGYTTSIYTVSIGAISDHGLSTYYTESCASTLAVTYSGGSHREKRENKIITTTLNHKCTDQFKGTSSAAPLAAGMIALMLEANSKLTWRDVQSIIVETALMTSPLDEGWRRNGAGKWFNQKFGFGRMDASQLVTKAKNWDNIPEQRKCWGNKNDGPWKIPESGTVLVATNASACSDTALEIRSLEHVQLVISLKHRYRGHLSIELISPSGTRSQILKTRRNDHSNKGLKDWIFMSVHFWGEDPRGTWTLAVTDNNNNNKKHYRSKVKHGDVEDATEALQDELIGRPRPQEEDVESSSQQHEGVLEKSENKETSKISEDFEGGIFDKESYRSSRKQSKKKKKPKKKQKKKGKKHKKEKNKKHHRHYHSHKKSKPTGKIKEFTAEPTFFGKTFGALTKNRQGQNQYHITPTQPRNGQGPNLMPQMSQNVNSNRNDSNTIGQNGQANQVPGIQSLNGAQEPASQSSIMEVNPDKTLRPTTRHRFESTTTASSQHDVIQGLVKSVLSELFTALRAQRNESQGSILGLVGSELPAKVSEKEPAENVSSSLSKAWNNEKGVKKISALIAILDKLKTSPLKSNASDIDSNSTGADEMVSDVLKVLRDILSASKTNDKGKEFKMRVAKLVNDSSIETRNLTQRLFDDLQDARKANSTPMVINDAMSLISAIFEDDSQKKKIAGLPETIGAVPLDQIGIIVRRPDGSLIIPNTVGAGIQVQSNPETMLRTWSNGSQIETVRIEHTKVSPVNFANVESKAKDADKNQVTDTNLISKANSSEKLVKEKGKEKDGDNDIEIEVERSGDGKEKEFTSRNKNDVGPGRNGQQNLEKPDVADTGSILNMRTIGSGVSGQKMTGVKYRNFGPIGSKFLKITKEKDVSSVLGMDKKEEPVLDVKNERHRHGQEKPDSDSNNGDDQIDVTVFFDNNSDNDFTSEVKKIEADDGSRKHGTPSSKQRGQAAIERSPGAKYGSMKHLGNIAQNFRFQMEEDDDESEAGGFRQSNDEGNSRSKGEIPESEDDENEDETESSTNGVEDMRDTLPFFTVPVADQHGYSLLTQMFDPFQDGSYTPDFDIVNAEVQAPLVEEDNDYFEPQAYKHEWRRSIPDSFPSNAKSLGPNSHTGFPHVKDSNLKLLRSRRAVPKQKLASSVKIKSKPATDIASARKRFAEIVRRVHENSARPSLLGLDRAPVSKRFVDKPMLQTDFAQRPFRNRQRRAVTDAQQLTLKQQQKSSPDFLREPEIYHKRKRRSVDTGESESQSQPKDSARVAADSSDRAVYRQKRDKIIDDYDNNGDDGDYENEPHVVKRSAIFGDLDSLQEPENGNKEMRSRREAEDDESNDEEQPPSRKQKVSSLEDALRTKLLSMKTQSKAVLKLLKRVHEDISSGNTEDLFKLEADIANVEKRDKEKQESSSDDDEEEKKHQKAKKNKKKGKHVDRKKTNQDKLKAKSVTPNVRPGSQSRPISVNYKTEDSVEAQEKLAYKQDPDEYLKYGAGNTGVLESWTLVFYGT